MAKDTFADRLKQAMEQRGKKQIDLIHAAAGQGVKIGKSHISQYVNGKNIPRADILHCLATILNVDEEWLKSGQTAEVSFQEQEHMESTGGRPMREFRKSSKLNNVLYDVRGPVVDEAARMEEAGTQILKLNIGNPAPFGFRTPDEVIYDMRRQLTECEEIGRAHV